MYGYILINKYFSNAFKHIYKYISDKAFKMHHDKPTTQHTSFKMQVQHANKYYAKLI